MIIIIMIMITMGDARVRVKVEANPGFRIEDLNAKTISKRCRRDNQGSNGSWVRRCPSVGCPSVGWCPWRAIDGTARGPRSMAPCVARRSNVAVHGLCGAIGGTVRGAIAVSDRSNVALRGLCNDFCQNSSEPRCGRSLRPIVFSTLVSYCAGRCLRT